MTIDDTCPGCERTRDELAEEGIGWDRSVFAECEECDPGGETRHPVTNDFGEFE